MKNWTICLKTNTIHSQSRFTALTKHLTNNRLSLLKISRHRILIVMNEPNIFKQILSNIHRVVTIIVILFQTLINFRTLSINLRIIALKYNSTFDSNLPTLPCIPILVQISWTRIAIKNAMCPIKNCKAHFAGGEFALITLISRQGNLRERVHWRVEGRPVRKSTIRPLPRAILGAVSTWSNASSRSRPPAARNE